MTVAEQVPASVLTTGLVDTLMVGGVWSVTVTMMVHGVALLPAASVAPTTTASGWPSVTGLPAGGLCVMVMGAALLSVAVTFEAMLGKEQLALSGYGHREGRGHHDGAVQFFHMAYVFLFCVRCDSDIESSVCADLEAAG